MLDFQTNELALSKGDQLVVLSLYFQYHYELMDLHAFDVFWDTVIITFVFAQIILVCSIEAYWSRLLFPFDMILLLFDIIPFCLRLGVPVTQDFQFLNGESAGKIRMSSPPLPYCTSLC